MDAVLVCRLHRPHVPGKLERCSTCKTAILLSPDRESFLAGRPDARLVCIACVPKDAELLGPGRSFSLEELAVKSGVKVGHDMRDEDGFVPAKELGGACSRCGSSFLKGRDVDGLCRPCAKATSRPAGGPPTRRPEPAIGGAAPEVAMCSEDDCCRTPFYDGLCKTHHEQKKARAVSDGRFSIEELAKDEPVVAEVETREEEPMVATKKRETLSCDECEFTSDWPPAMANHKRVLHGGAKKTAAPSAPKKESRVKPATKGVAHRDTKPENELVPAGAPSPVARELEPEFEVMFSLAELAPAVRQRVLEWASARWLRRAEGA